MDEQKQNDEWDVVFPVRRDPPPANRRIKSAPIGETMPTEQQGVALPPASVSNRVFRSTAIPQTRPARMGRTAMQVLRDQDQAKFKPGEAEEIERVHWIAMRYLQRQALTVSHPNDPAEKEADEIADRVMRMPAGRQEREGVGLDVARGEGVQLSIDGEIRDEEAGEALPIRISEEVSRTPTADEDLSVSRESAEQIARVTSSGGKPLENAGFFEERMGADFSGVRVHTGPEAAKAAEGVQAKAFTLGRDVVFGEGQYRPETSDGQRLIAHELMHTIQQGSATPKRGGVFAKLARSVGKLWRQVVQRASEPQILAPAQIQNAIRENRRRGHEVTEGLLSDLYRMTGEDAMYRAARNYAWRQNGTEVVNGRRQLKASSAGIGPDFVKLVALAQKTKLALPATGIIDTRTESIGRLFLRNRPAMIQSAIEDIAKNIELIQFRPARSAIVTRLQSMNGAELRDVIGGLTVRFPRHRESGSFALWLYNRLPEFRTEMEVILSSAGLLEPILWQEARRILAKPGAEEASQLLLKRQGSQLHILLGALLQQRSPRVAATFLFEEVLSDRLAQEKVRQHFFTQGGVALQFAVEHTAARIVDRIDGYTGLADSYDVAWSFRTTPAAHRNTVLSTLDKLTRAKWGQSAAVALNEDINETAYNQIRTALGVRLPPFDPTIKSAAAKAADVLEYGVIAVEVVSGVLAGIVTGVAMFLWDFIGLAIDLIKLGYYLNMSLFYWLSFGAIGQSEWIAVRDGTLGIIEGLKDPGALFKEAWAQTVLNADTIGGPFEYFRRTEYWTRLIIYFLLTVVTIVKGLIRGGQAAARWAARQRQMARFRRIAGEIEDASHVRPPAEPARPGAPEGGSPERPTRPGDGDRTPDSSGVPRGSRQTIRDIKAAVLPLLNELVPQFLRERYRWGLSTAAYQRGRPIDCAFGVCGAARPVAGSGRRVMTSTEVAARFNKGVIEGLEHPEIVALFNKAGIATGDIRAIASISEAIAAMRRFPRGTQFALEFSYIARRGNIPLPKKIRASEIHKWLDQNPGIQHVQSVRRITEDGVEYVSFQFSPYTIRGHVVYGRNDGVLGGVSLRETQTLFGEKVVFTQKELDAILPTDMYLHILKPD